MSIFGPYDDSNAIGEVRGVDTSQVYVRVTSAEKLLHAKVGRLVVVQGEDANEWLLGMINRVWREPSSASVEEATADDFPLEENAVQLVLVGTYRALQGDRKDYFTRAVLSLPDINRSVYPVEGRALESLMGLIARSGSQVTGPPLEIGTYSLDRKAKAYLDADRLFQRHAALLGSTGSGKSWAVATILEQAAELANPNIILFDLHGEYVDVPYAKQLRIAGPGDLANPSDSVLFLPLWLLNYEEMQSVLVDYSEQSAPNQATAVFESIMEAKERFLTECGQQDMLDKFTVDSPIPFRLEAFIGAIDSKNREVIDTGDVYKQGDQKGQPKTRQGPLHDKLTRMLIRLRNKTNDRRYGFMFRAPSEWQQYDTLDSLTSILMGSGNGESQRGFGIRVIDFSEVPSDVLPVMVSLVARLVFNIQFWLDSGANNSGRHPILLVCDEAHLYLPGSGQGVNATERLALESFERIAKEGRKYGVGLLVVSQRPSDVSTTILSQCNNIISLRLTTDRDISAVKNLVPDTLGGLLDVLPGLEVGEALAVGDSVLLPLRILMNRPTYPPKSATMDFWTRWGEAGAHTNLRQAVESFRRQSRK